MSAAGFTGQAAPSLEAHKMSVALAWHSLVEAGCEHAIARERGEASAHELERLEAAHKAAAIAYTRAVDAAHDAARSALGQGRKRRRK